MATKRKIVSRQQKKVKEIVSQAVIHIYCSFNNTIITLARPDGSALRQESSGTIGYKGSKKSTPYAAQVVSRKIIDWMKKYKVQELQIRTNGFGPGRSSSLRVFEAEPIKITKITDVTPIAHNGCRPPKKPRG